jgi:putative oxidoreductase
MSVDAGLLILRVVVGVLFMGHGAQKLFGWFGGPGLGQTAGWFESQGMRPARMWAFLAGLGEFGGGLLLALGLLGPLGGVAIAATMFVAIVKMHAPNGLWAQNNGYEYPLVLMVVALVLAAVGPGSYSLDRVLGIEMDRLIAFWSALILALIVVVAGLLIPSPQRMTQAGQRR